MQKAIIDTNLIIRFLLNDDPEKALKVEKLLGSTKDKFLIPDIIIAEIIWVLSSYYEFEKSAIVDRIKALVHFEAISCSRNLLDHALNIWGKHNVSFIDAYLVAMAQIKGLKIYTYDFKFDKIEGIERIERLEP